jgi:hypothetical protein
MLDARPAVTGNLFPALLPAGLTAVDVIARSY